MIELHQLLAVQDHDTRIDQLNHRRATMPERARLAALRQAGERLVSSTSELSAERSALAQEQRRLEDEIAMVESKRSSVDATLYGGTVSNPKELQYLQEEIASLKRRQGQLEDQAIEIMERTEPVDVRLNELAKEAEVNTSDISAGEQTLAQAEREVESELASELAARDEARVGLPDALLEEYAQLRGRSGGVGVARLAGSQCGACHLTLSAVEVARIKKLPSGAVAHCEECGRILVR